MEKRVSLADDSFVHFTYVDRAKEIVEDGVILANPPYGKMGIAGVQAVSVNYGQYVPTVQTTHLKDDKKIVAVLFKTNTMPKIGYPEEVIWDGDVRLKESKIIPAIQAIRMLSTDDEDFTLIYESVLNTLL